MEPDNSNICSIEVLNDGSIKFNGKKEACRRAMKEININGDE